MRNGFRPSTESPELFDRDPGFPSARGMGVLRSIPRLLFAGGRRGAVFWAFRCPYLEAGLGHLGNIVAPNHGCCRETFYIFACCVLMGNPHLTAKIVFCSPSNVNQEMYAFLLLFGMIHVFCVDVLPDFCALQGFPSQSSGSGRTLGLQPGELEVLRELFN